MKNLLEKIKERWVCITLIISLISLSGYLFASMQNYKFEILYHYKIVPKIELINTLYETKMGLSGEVRGFVKFEDTTKQPKGAEQYIEIISFESTNEKGEQLFLLRNIVAMSSLSPRQISVDKLYKTNETITDYILEDTDGNQYIINKVSKQVSLRGTDGDYSVLLTNDLEFKNFIIQKNK